DWSSDVCSSDLLGIAPLHDHHGLPLGTGDGAGDDPSALELIRGRHTELLETDLASADVVDLLPGLDLRAPGRVGTHSAHLDAEPVLGDACLALLAGIVDRALGQLAHPQVEGIGRSEEHTSELQS